MKLPLEWCFTLFFVKNMIYGKIPTIVLLLLFNFCPCCFLPLWNIYWKIMWTTENCKTSTNECWDNCTNLKRLLCCDGHYPRTTRRTTFNYMDWTCRFSEWRCLVKILGSKWRWRQLWQHRSLRIIAKEHSRFRLLLLQSLNICQPLLIKVIFV